MAGIDRGEALSGDWSTMMTLSTLSRPRISRNPFVGVALEALVEDVVEERALARAGNAGDAGEDAEGDADVDVLEVVLVGVADLEEGLGRPPRRRDGRSPSRRACTGR